MSFPGAFSAAIRRARGLAIPTPDRCRCAVLAVGLFAAMTSPLGAQLPNPRLHWVYPPGGQRGTDVDVTIRGLDLDADTGGVQELSFSHPGITAEQKTASPPPFETEPRRLPGQFVVTIAGDVPVGTHEVRVRGRYGLSTSRLFSVGDLSERLEQGGNNRLASPMPLELNSVVNGRAGGDSFDVYQFTASAGQRVRLHCATSRLDSRMDATMMLLDATGEQLADSRNARGGEPVIDFTAPADGSYLVQVHDSTYRGGEPFFYRLSFSTPPHLDVVFPHVGTYGTIGTLTPHGRDLPAATAAGIPEQEPNDDRNRPQQITVPCEVDGQFSTARDRDWFSFQAKRGERFAVEVLSQRRGLPTDPVLLVQHVSADERGEPTVRDVAEADDIAPGFTNPPFDTPIRDAALVLTADADGTYRVLVRDLNSGTTPDPRHVYSLLVTPPKPDFRLLATFKAFANPDPEKTLRAAPILRPGGTKSTVVQAYRRDGFAGPITVTARGLPDGVVCPPVVIPAGQNRATLVLAAAESAPPSTVAIRIFGTAFVADKEVHREAFGSVVIWDKNRADETTDARRISDIPLSVIADPQPLSVAIDGESTRLTSRAGKLSIPVRITRRAGANGAIELRAQGLPAEIKAAALELDSEATEGTLKLTVEPDAPIGPCSFHLAGQSKVSYRRNPEAAREAKEDKDRLIERLAELTSASQPADAATLQAARQAQPAINQRAAELSAAAAPKEIDVFVESLPVTLRVAAAPVTLTATPLAAIPLGGQGEISVQVERQADFAAAVDLEVIMPDGVSGIQTDNTSVAAGQAAGTLVVKAAADATPGTHEFTLHATVRHNGHALQIDQPLMVKVDTDTAAERDAANE